MIEFTILFVGVLVMGYLVEKESKRIQKKNKDVWIFSYMFINLYSIFNGTK